MTSTQHIPVLLDEVLAWLDPRPGQRIVDGTLGGGGHTRALAERVGPEGCILALDRDPVAIARAETLLAGLPIKLGQADYRELPAVLAEVGWTAIDGLLVDLGLSSDQLADAERGFSFNSDGPLDLRFDPSHGTPAAQWLARVSERELADVLYQFGEERHSRRIARAIVHDRRDEPFRTARQLADLVARIVPRSPHDRIHPATRTFQALRIVVNDELGALDTLLQVAPAWLKPGGRAAFISFHSLEDRRVKEAFRDDPRWEPLVRKPVVATDAELDRNPRARSAKLRVAARSILNP